MRDELKAVGVAVDDRLRTWTSADGRSGTLGPPGGGAPTVGMPNIVLPEVASPHHSQPALSPAYSQPAYPGYPPNAPAGYEQHAAYDAYYQQQQQQQQQQQYAAYYYAAAGQQPAPGQPPYAPYGAGYPSR